MLQMLMVTCMQEASTKMVGSMIYLCMYAFLHAYT